MTGHLNDLFVLNLAGLAWRKISSEGNLLAKEPGEESLISNIEVLKTYGIYLN